MSTQIKYIDLFAGIGGFRVGFESAMKELGFEALCVFSSDIKPSALNVYSANFDHVEATDITQVNANAIPDFDYLLGGFPCQAFSSAGKRDGFLDTRGTLFFDVERILEAKKPAGFILENVEGLVNHDKIDKSKPIGRTLETILERLTKLGYKTTWKVLNASDFGLAQNRKRIFIVGSRNEYVRLNNFPSKITLLRDILESNLPAYESQISNLLLSKFKIKDLYGKSIKDKRGGPDNIHSWDLELKGPVSEDQKLILEKILRARRNKKWGDQKGIQWMDGMPLTLDEISTFCFVENLQEKLDDLVKKGYVTFEHPKDISEVPVQGGIKKIRLPRLDLPKGYNIVAGKLSFQISKILDPDHIAPTLVATDVDKIAVVDNQNLRKLSQIELKRLFGFPDDLILIGKPSEIYDLFGNSVPVNVVKAIAERLISVDRKLNTSENFTTNSSHSVEQLELVLSDNP